LVKIAVGMLLFVIFLMEHIPAENDYRRLLHRGGNWVT
jgi:hypothetical protein